ncbi:MAG TPA: AraC family transcriptional regulator [Chitinophaga sp.]|uniref:helix-turn-helix domain-containing protein n=1 Tax=Chitinophaga sp. TaxID=1869181 RepID=UPI002C22A36C|nr:AraC family transcriptional regulator [Chitinophaga sp.]HVI48815.1 AraC family transcriptional regulator [Chitinophaga sp.]
MAEQVDITVKELEEGTRIIRADNDFRLIYVIDGAGTFQAEENCYQYSRRKLFLLRHGGRLKFDVKTAGRIAVLRFSPAFTEQLIFEAERIETCDNLSKMDYIFHNYHAKAGCIFRDKADEQFAFTLLDSILREDTARDQGYLLIVRQSLSILINLITRNLIRSEQETVMKNSNRFLIMKIISYLQQHISEPALTRIDTIAAKFNISPSYLGEYFKKHTGASIQDYLLEYRLKLVETRLAHSNMRLKEIAMELSFNDESYLSRIFKKYKGMTPGAYRKSRRKDTIN